MIYIAIKDNYVGKGKTLNEAILDLNNEGGIDLSELEDIDLYKAEKIESIIEFNIKEKCS